MQDRSLLIEAVNLRQPPRSTRQENQRHFYDVTIGDLHAAFLKAVYFLLKENIYALSDEDYNKFIELTEIPIDDIIKENLDEMKRIISSLTLVSNNKRVIFLGDQFYDRNFYELVMPWIYEKLHQDKVPVIAVHANHDMEMVLASERDALARKNRIIYSMGFTRFNIDPSCSQSIDNLNTLILSDLTTKEEILDLIDKYYIPNTRLIAYTLDAEDAELSITLYTHSPKGLSKIKALAHSFGLAYNDKTTQQLAETIDNINNHFYNEYVLQYKVWCIYHPNSLLFDFLWDRDYDLADQPLIHPQGGYLIRYVNGHWLDYNLKAEHIIQLDNILLKTTETYVDEDTGEIVDPYCGDYSVYKTRCPHFTEPALSAVKERKFFLKSLRGLLDDRHISYNIESPFFKETSDITLNSALYVLEILQAKGYLDDQVFQKMVSIATSENLDVIDGSKIIIYEEKLIEKFNILMLIASYNPKEKFDFYLDLINKTNINPHDLLDLSTDTEASELDDFLPVASELGDFLPIFFKKIEAKLRKINPRSTSITKDTLTILAILASLSQKGKLIINENVDVENIAKTMTFMLSHTNNIEECFQLHQDTAGNLSYVFHHFLKERESAEALNLVKNILDNNTGAGPDTISFINVCLALQDLSSADLKIEIKKKLKQGFIQNLEKNRKHGVKGWYIDVDQCIAELDKSIKSRIALKNQLNIDFFKHTVNASENTTTEEVSILNTLRS